MNALNDKKLPENILVKIDLALKSTQNVPSRKLSSRPLKSLAKTKSMRPRKALLESIKPNKDLE
jgi:hypothetical protein